MNIYRDKLEELRREFLQTIQAQQAEIDQLKRYGAEQDHKIKALTETHVLYPWLRKKCDEPSNNVVAVHMNIGHDWTPVQDLDRDLRTMIDQEEP